MRSQVRTANPACIGFAVQPDWGGGMVPTLNVMDRGPNGSYRGLAKVRASTVTTAATVAAARVRARAWTAAAACSRRV